MNLKRATWLLVFIFLLGYSELAISRLKSYPELPTKYDDQIRKATKKYLGRSWTWTLYYGQLYQESLLDSSAISSANARGVAQFIPSTWGAIIRDSGLCDTDCGNISPHNSSIAIDAGAYYLSRLWQGWTSPRPVRDRKRLAMASYNAGFGGVLRSQKACGGKLLYEEIAPCLPKETREYIPRIEHWQRVKESQI